MRTYARAYKDIWNEQFSGVLSLDLHRENKTEAKKVCLLIDFGFLQLRTEQAIKTK